MAIDDKSVSLSEVHHSVPIPRGTGFFRRLLAFAGPAYLVSVGYMDPGNWATDLEGGARFGYKLIWVILMSNAMAVLLQTLSARFGIVTGQDLAQACRKNYPRTVAHALWVLCENWYKSTFSYSAFVWCYYHRRRYTFISHDPELWHP